MKNLTTLEQAALAALRKSSAGNGHDFGIMEDVLWMGGRKQLGALVTNLSRKGVIQMHEPVRVNGDELVTQYVLAEAYRS